MSGWFGLCLLLVATSTWADCWQPVNPLEPLRLTARQAGAPVTGSFTRYSGLLCLPTANDPGRATVVIDTNSIDMGLEEFNTEMRGPLFLDTETWPTAELVSTSLTSIGGDRYRVTGELRIRDVARPVTTEFTARRVSGKLSLHGEFTFNRLDYQLGLGEWQDTTWVGANVTVQVDSTLRPTATDSYLPATSNITNRTNASISGRYR